MSSTVARQLAFGEGAIFWFFLNENTPMYFIAIGLLCLVLYFVFDILQYIVGAALNKNLAEVYEKLNEDNSLNVKNVVRPKSMNTPMYFCYYAKFLMLSIASLLLIGLVISIFTFK